MAENRPTRDSVAAEREAEAVGADTPICIVGMGLRLPGGYDEPQSFYDALLGGLDAMKEVPPERWDASWLDDPRRCMGTIKGIDEFDARFFSISHAEASRMDPQHRILLEASVHALQDAGVRLGDVAATRTGVFVGCSSQEYAVIQLGPGGYADVGGQTNTGVALSIASNRISYLLDLRGPSFTVDTACSSSLLAVHLAVSALRRGECTMALAGGANALLGPGTTLGFARGGFLSSDGHCKAFDESANGFARSEGSAVLVLKPLPAALRDGDRIYATILGTATNEDGLSEGGMTHPSQRAQREVMVAALRDAKVRPDQVQYVEAHGTGTPVGDPIEVGAIGEVIGAARDRGHPLVVGSVKTNLGHLEPASGAAGLAKLALAMHGRVIPGNLHFNRPNPAIKFDELNVRVAVGPTQWPAAPGEQIYAGINSFGFGGANVHAVLSGAPLEAQQPAPAAVAVASSGACDDLRVHVLRIGARSLKSLRAAAADYAALIGRKEHPLGVVCRAAAALRDGLELRAAVVASNADEMVARLEALAAAEDTAAAVDGVERGRKPDDAQPRVAFVCSGQGPQWARMTCELMQKEPVFADVVRRVDGYIAKLRPGWSLIEELERGVADTHIGNTFVAQPALMAVHIGLAELWKSRGVQPHGVVGHSVGEVAAAYIAGALTLEQACVVIHHRSRVQAMASGKGRMLAVGLNEQEAAKLLPADGSVSIAAANAPSATTLSGDATVLAAIAKVLDARRVFCRFLRVDTPFHSAVMEPLRGDLLEALAELRPARCEQGIELWSSVSGKQVDGTHATAEHWYANVRQPVLFERAIRDMIAAGYNAFVELSPHPALASSISEIAKAVKADALVVTSMRNTDGACQSLELAKAEAKMFAWGYDVHVRAGRAERAVKLPLYEWDRERFWQEADAAAARRRGACVHPHLREVHTSLREPSNAVIDLNLDVARDHPYLRDHALNGQIVLPAAAFTDLALSAGRTLFGDRAGFVEDVHFAKAMFLPARARIDVSSDRGCYYIYSRPDMDDSAGLDAWTLNSQGRVNFLEDEFVPRRAEMTLDALKALCDVPGEPTALYDGLNAVGLELGPAFRCMREVWVGPGRQSLARIALPPALAEDARHRTFSLHPCLMDAAIISLFAPLEWEPTMGAFLPNSLQRARAAPGGAGCGPELWAHCVIVETCADHFVADMRWMAPSGEVVAEVQGFKLKLIPGSADKRSLPALGALYQWSWAPRALPQVPAQAPAGRALVVTDMRESDECVLTLRYALGDCVVRSAGDAEALGAAVADYATVVLALGPAAEGSAPAQLASAPRALLAIAQAIAATPRGRAPKALAVVTRGAQQAVAGEAVPGVAQGALWGMARSLLHEMTPATGTRVCVVDAPHALASADLAALSAHVAAFASGAADCAVEAAPAAPQKAKDTTELWFSRANAVERPKLRLVCFPFHLGGPSAFASWADRVGPAVELYAARVPGWESRESETAPADVAALVAPFADAAERIVCAADGAPWAVYGHSLGAMVAYEFVRAVAARFPSARPPARLFVAACPSPAWFDGKKLADAFQVRGAASADGEAYRAPEARGLCAVTAFSALADTVFEPALVRGWDKVAAAGQFECVELAECPHLFLNARGAGGAESPSEVALRVVLERTGAVPSNTN
eukprot:m51a1_g5796 putative polyketide synthase (1657) ;mRNA; r:57386-62949